MEHVVNKSFKKTHTHLHQHRLRVALLVTCTRADEQTRNVEVSMYVIATIRYEHAKDGTHLPKFHVYDLLMLIDIIRIKLTCLNLIEYSAKTVFQCYCALMLKCTSCIETTICYTTNTRWFKYDRD